MTLATFSKPSFSVRTKRFVKTFVRLALCLVPLYLAGCACCSKDGGSTSLRQALTFHASFDRGLDADFAKGDPAIYHTANMKRPRTAIPGLPNNGAVEWAKDQGRFGHALRFTKKAPEVSFFKGKENFNFSASHWSGTVSLWLKVDPKTELAPGYCDPIQITSKEWNDASFFVEFEKKADLIPFRLGAYPDFKVWNERNRKWEEIPFEEKPLVSVLRPPFRGDRWTHVVFTFEQFNSGSGDGLARLYLDGKPANMISPRLQTYTWSLDDLVIMLGVSYIGLYDDLSVFNRALSEVEVQRLHALPRGVTGLIR